ncbi:MAG: NAD(P)H-binding protein, partial [Pseudobdellovibrionaceae bacterium]|nr:NAD(P)H-binding protein [Pseudobdellovibrionaceae bacterium]
MKALIFGSSGLVGQEVLKNLEAQNIPVHAVRRLAPGVKGTTRWFTHDLLQGAGSTELWDGVTHVFVLTPAGYMNQDQIIIPVVEKAKSQKVQKIVLMTAMGANYAVGSPLQKAEVALQQSGLDSAIIRPNWFMQNFHTYWGHALRTEHIVAVPAGNAKTSFIDVRDIGAVAAKLLTTKTIGAFDITGPEALT